MNKLNTINSLIFESYWPYDNITVDENKKELPFPKSEKWNNRELFLGKLDNVETYLTRINKFNKYYKSEYKDCILCHQKNITTGYFELNNINWENGLFHYIEKHKTRPSEDYIDIIFKFNERELEEGREVARFKSVVVKEQKLKYMKLDINQLLIIDALMIHGSYSKKYIDTNNFVYRYSEHAGLLDFSNNGLDKIIISGKTNRIDSHDFDIFLPKNMVEAYDYEYIFHTHPATPKPGGRAKEGILYEFPSVGDIFHFIEHFNNGITQGSIIVTAEGLYNIRKYKVDRDKLDFDENSFYNKLNDGIYKVQKEAINKYGTEFNNKKFYSEIAQDNSYIDKLNKILNEFNLHIDYFSRSKDNNNNWIIESVYLPVYPIEIK